MWSRWRKAAPAAALFTLMAGWEWLATADIIFTADRALASIPLAIALATCSFFGITGLRRNWTYGIAWIGGAGVGRLIGIFFP